MDMEKRIRMSTESILENESLREGLDDEGASALMEWGIARAKQIANDTAGLQDETEAEQASHPRMRALRKMLRSAARSCAENMDIAEYDALLAEVISLIPLVYGEGTALPEVSQRNNLLAAETNSVRDKINALRNFIENNSSMKQGD